MNTLRIVLVLLPTLLSGAINIRNDAPVRVLIDADTANEVDDLFAVVRALLEPGFEIVGLNSTQWQASHWATPNTLEDSHRINTRLLAYLQKSHLPHPRGAQDRLYDWGQDIARHSAAAYHIIKEAHKTPENQRLTILALGALTNVASALLIDPTIVQKIRLYWLGTSYDPATKIWRKLDFNCMMDPGAVEIVLGNQDLETHVMPVTTASALTFGLDEVAVHLKNKNDVRGFLHERWMQHMDGGVYRRTIWDLSIIPLVLHPQWAVEESVKVPPENGDHNVYVTLEIDAIRIKKDFWEVLEQRLDE